MKGKTPTKAKDNKTKKIRLSLEDLEVEGKDVKGGAAVAGLPRESTYMCPW